MDYIDYLKDRENLFNKISNRSSIIIKAVNKIDNVLDIEYSRNIINKIAFHQALLFIKSKAAEILILSFEEAAMSTEEYNYDLYLNRLASALFSHAEEIITFMPIANTIKFGLNLESLGTVDEWEAAVEKVRNEILGTTSDPEVASRMWEEKIYKTGREGKSIYRTKKVKDKRYKSGYREEKVDVTDRYRGKYRETIAMRLSFISPDKAPFWYLIEHGNIGIGFARGGTEYPSNPPARVIDSIADNLYQYFEVAYEEYKAKADVLLSRKLSESLKNAQELAEISTDNARAMADYLENKTPPMLIDGQSIIEESNNTIENFIREVEEVTYYIKGRKVTRLRDIITKRFI